VEQQLSLIVCFTSRCHFERKIKLRKKDGQMIKSILYEGLSNLVIHINISDLRLNIDHYSYFLFQHSLLFYY